MKILLLVLCTAAFFCTNAQKQKLVDSLIKVADLAPDSLKMKIYGDIGWEMKDLDAEKALVFIDKGIAIATKLNSQKYIAQGYNDKGAVQFLLGKKDAALQSYNQSLKIREALNDKNGLASLYNKIGILHNTSGKYDLAIEMQLKCIKYYEEIKDTLKQVSTNNNLAELYNKLGKIDESLTYSNHNLKLLTNKKESPLVGATYLIMANTYLLNSNYVLAEKYYNIALPILKKFEVNNELASGLNNFGSLYEKQNNQEAAYQKYEEAYNLAKSKNNIRGAAVYLTNMGIVEVNQNKLTEAEEHLTAAKLLTDSSNQMAQLINVYKGMAKLYVKKKDEQKAIYYINAMDSLRSDLFSDNMTAQFAEMQTKYETEKKESQIKSQQLALRNKQLWIFGILGFLGLITLAGLLYFNKFKAKKQAELSQVKLQQQEEKTNAIIEAEEKERIRVARELHDGVGQLMSASRLTLGNLEADNTLNPSQQAAVFNSVKMVDDAIKELRSVSHNMLPNALLRNGLVSAMREFVQQLNQQATIKIGFETAGLDSPLPQNKEAVLYRILQELMQNIIKHAQATQVNISFIGDAKEATLMVEDNGKGFDVNNTKNFEGIGLKNIMSRVQFIKGEVHWDSTIGKGTTVTVEMPI